MEKSKFIYMNGKFIPWDEAKIHVLTHTLHYGNGVIEGLRAYRTVDGRCAIFKLEEHTQRLLESAKMLLLNSPYSKDELNLAQIQLLKSNELYNGAYIRPIIYLGYGVMGIYHKNCPVDVSISAWEWKNVFSDKSVQEGIRVKISSMTRISNTSSMGKAKAISNYLNSQMAKFEAVESGYDEALLRDDQGYISESSGACFFMIKNGELISPPTDNTLESITQKTIIELANDMNINVIRRRITREEIYVCDECFLVGTAVEVVSIKEVDARIIGGKDEISKKLKNAYFNVVTGKDKKYSKYLTYIN